MPDTIKILQYNIRGIVSKHTQLYKCPKLYSLMKSKHIDIVLLQEWCATTREDVVLTETNSDCSGHNSVCKFPSGFFPDYHTHFHSTECAILYHKDLCVTPLDRPTFTADSPTQTYSQAYNVGYIMLVLLTTIYNVYRQTS